MRICFVFKYFLMLLTSKTTSITTIMVIGLFEEFKTIIKEAWSKVTEVYVCPAINLNSFA